MNSPMARRHRILSFLAVCVAVRFSTNCSSYTVAGPPEVAHPLSAYVQVPYPPPAVQVEAVPQTPNDAAVWVDGYWLWRSGSYIWMRGGWVLVPPEGRFARFQSHYNQDGVLMFASGIWYDAKGSRLRRAPLLLPAFTPSNENTSELRALPSK